MDFDDGRKILCTAFQKPDDYLGIPDIPFGPQPERFFYQELQRMGYLVRYDSKRKYNTLQIPGTKHPTRFKMLGENYTEEAIRRHILQNRTPSRPLPPPPKMRPFTVGKSGFRGLYLHYCYLLGVIRKSPHPHYNAALRAEARKAEEYSDQARLLCHEQIDTAEQLQDFMEKAQEKIPAMVKERERLYKQISRCGDNSRFPELIQQRDALTEVIGKLRKELKNAKAVMERSNLLKIQMNKQERSERIAKEKKDTIHALGP